MGNRRFRGRGADRHQRETRQAIAEKSFVQDRGMTVAELLEDFMARKRRAGRKDSTLDGYQAIIDNHLVPHLGRHRLSNLRPDHIEAMLERIARTPSNGTRLKGKKPPGAGTLVNIRAVLRPALNDAVRRQLVPRNVATLVSLPSPSGSGRSPWTTPGWSPS